MKRTGIASMSLLLLLAGCSNTAEKSQINETELTTAAALETNAETPSESSAAPNEGSENEAASQFTVKTGVSFDETWGLTISNIIEDNGKVVGVLADTFRNGESSKEKYDNYGVKPVSTLGKEWWEQVKFYENWVVENGVDTVEYDEEGHATNPDLISGATINISYYTEAIKNASDEPEHEIAGFTVKTGTSYNETWGLTVANVIEQDNKIIGVLVDTFRDGESSKEKFDNYGVKSISTLEKDWWEQIKFYENWVVENGVDAVKYDEDGHATVDLISGATINISDFTKAIEDALNK